MKESKKKKLLELAFKELKTIKQPSRLVIPSKFLSYISTYDKYNLEKEIPRKIRPWLLNYIKRHEDNINKLIEEPTELFIYHLLESWNKHNQISQLLDQFLFMQRRRPFKEWSLKDWELAKSLAKKALEVDHLKTLYSGALKRKIEKEVLFLKEKYNLSQDDVILLLTPSFGVFETRYFLDHLRYFLKQNYNIETGIEENYLLETYHGSDKELAQLRLNEFNFHQYSRNYLVNLLEETENRLKETAIKKGYFVLEKPYFKLVDKLLEIDNWLEPLWAKSLMGIPYLLFFEEIINLLKESDLLEKDKTFFDLDDKTFFDLVDKQIERVRKEFRINLRVYYQHYDTCGVCCTMSILERVGMKITNKTEEVLWGKVGKPFNFPQGLALLMMKKGLRINFYHYPNRLFWLDHKDIKRLEKNPQDFYILEKYLNMFYKALNSGMELTIKDWNSNDVLNNLLQGNICQCYIKFYDNEEILHAVNVIGYKEGQFIVQDPIYEEFLMEPYQLDNLIDTYMGKRMLVIKNTPSETWDYFQNSLKSL